MAFTRNLLIMLAAVATALIMSASFTSARELGIPKTDFDSNNNMKPVDVANCWNALAEVRMCSNEIIGFFLNGAAEIDTPCCTAIEVIMHHCMPDMLASLGFTVEQGRLLQGYCDQTASAAPVSAPPANTKQA
ncbi:hypothetical protein Droror1_Dr00022448 [Drosera rotundifolia]